MYITAAIALNNSKNLRRFFFFREYVNFHFCTMPKLLLNKQISFTLHFLGSKIPHAHWNLHPFKIFVCIAPAVHFNQHLQPPPYKIDARENASDCTKLSICRKYTSQPAKPPSPSRNKSNSSARFPAWNFSKSRSITAIFKTSSQLKSGATLCVRSAVITLRRSPKGRPPVWMGPDSFWRARYPYYRDEETVKERYVYKRRGPRSGGASLSWPILLRDLEWKARLDRTFDGGCVCVWGGSRVDAVVRVYNWWFVWDCVIGFWCIVIWVLGISMNLRSIW